jgi:hypothetical protein
MLIDLFLTYSLTSGLTYSLTLRLDVLTDLWPYIPVLLTSGLMYPLTSGLILEDHLLQLAGIHPHVLVHVHLSVTVQQKYFSDLQK